MIKNQVDLIKLLIIKQVLKDSVLKFNRQKMLISNLRTKRKQRSKTNTRYWRLILTNERISNKKNVNY